jgi:hypothetical protein
MAIKLNSRHFKMLKGNSVNPLEEEWGIWLHQRTWNFNDACEMPLAHLHFYMLLFATYSKTLSQHKCFVYLFAIPVLWFFSSYIWFTHSYPDSRWGRYGFFFVLNKIKLAKFYFSPVCVRPNEFIFKNNQISKMYPSLFVTFGVCVQAMRNIETLQLFFFFRQKFQGQKCCVIFY